MNTPLTHTNLQCLGSSNKKSVSRDEAPYMRVTNQAADNLDVHT